MEYWRVLTLLLIVSGTFITVGMYFEDHWNHLFISSTTLVASIPKKVDKMRRGQSLLHGILKQWNNENLYKKGKETGGKQDKGRVDNDGVTVVTAFMNIGDHPKGGGRRLVSTYQSWMHSWSKVRNPTVFYTDSPAFAADFSRFRSRYQDTMIMNASREELWSFRLVPRITEIFNQKRYPKHAPNTVVPTYPAVMSAKYDFLELTIKQNPFRTKYYMWLDLGLFRNYPRGAPCFILVPPPNFNESCIALNELSAIHRSTAKTIIHQNRVAIGGGVIFGTWNLLLDYVKQYREAARTLMDMNLMSTDQQVIFSLYADHNINKNKSLIPLQPYRMQSRQKYNGDIWFYLAYAMRKDGQCPKPTTVTGASTALMN